MHICIIEADRPADALIPRFGTYADMFERWLTPALPEATFSRAWFRDGAPLPAPETVDAVLITGSRCGVYDGHAWIDVLRDQLNRYAEAGTPMGGVCFGHQIMAEAFGGRVEKSDRGWGVGRQVHRLTPAGQRLFGRMDDLAALSFHQDQIVRLPAEGEVLLATDHSPYGGVHYAGRRAISVQFHPEFEPGYVRALLETGVGPGADHPLTAEALGTLAGPLDGAAVATAFAAVLRQEA